MADMFEYLKWRGDILFSQVPVNDVDALIFSTLAYVKYDGIVPEDLSGFLTLREVTLKFAQLEDKTDRSRVENDLVLLAAAAETERFGRVGMTFYRNVFVPEEETQFAGVAFLLEDGSAFLAFRGTDNTLVGWKEDFNMTFQESVPAQRLAQEYVRRFAEASRAPMYLGGHSKGGNLAVYAGAKSGPEIRDRMIAVYNHDGPGFTEHMMTDPGYLGIVPKIRTLVPQSSVFGMMLEHEEPCTIIRSKQIGVLQHDPYSWEVMGGGFVPVEELTADSRFLDRTLKTWLAGLTNEERSAFIDTVFDLLMIDETSRPRDVMRPQNVLSYFKTLQGDESRRKVIAETLRELLEAAKHTQAQQKEEKAAADSFLPGSESQSDT